MVETGYWNNFSKTLQGAMYCIRSDRSNWTWEEFMKSGEDDYRDYFSFRPMGSELPGYDKILEIGCGIGRILYGMKPLPAFAQYHGIDIDDGMIEWARHCPNYEFPKYQFSVCEGNGNINYQDNTFDYVISLICFQHIPSKSAQHQYIREIERVLKPGGFAKLMIQRPDYNEGRAPDMQVGVGMGVGEVRDCLSNSKLESADLKWRCQESRNWFAEIQKNG